ncbi:AAA family ATPase [Streptomyces caeruleatus]|uniref:ATP/GTP-binding protein n=1 Tax=Streptomyces caeruleatus TaxID=661399 RepID=A0A101TNM2_9ACTN|nr:AAA family ATPase [Streptomyces caeruleatus]KUN95660.1 ATP/GTP-binding protein [Streptomyces caeruleatus]
MKLAISGTYSSGKTLTTMALAHLTGIPRTHAKTMREILPHAVPGKTLEECNAAELIQLVMRRYVERAVHESHLPNGYISDGSSLHEWTYATVRVTVGINPNESIGLDSVEKTDEIRFYEQVVAQLGVALKQYAKDTYDAFVHLPIEFPLDPNGHRPVNERFRGLSDQLLLSVLQEELKIPVHIVGGSIPERLEAITALFGFPKVMSIEEAIAAARADYDLLDVRTEAERNAAAAQVTAA